MKNSIFLTVTALIVAAIFVFFPRGTESIIDVNGFYKRHPNFTLNGRCPYNTLDIYITPTLNQRGFPITAIEKYYDANDCATRTFWYPGKIVADAVIGLAAGLAIAYPLQKRFLGRVKK